MRRSKQNYRCSFCGKDKSEALILIAGIESAGRGNAALAGIAGLYALARVAHAIGMDAESFSRLRFVGTLVTMIVQLSLAIWAVGIALRVF